MWHSISCWPWATIWTAVSAIFSMVTVGVAVWAMFRWRKQDELKAKLNFKMEIAKYHSYVRVLSSEKSKMHEGHEKEGDRLADLQNAFNECEKAWAVTEGIIKGPAATHWNSIRINHSRFFEGKASTLDIFISCESILKEKFVFK